jgi:hypothetical protein
VHEIIGGHVPARPRSAKQALQLLQQQELCEAAEHQGWDLVMRSPIG